MVAKKQVGIADVLVLIKDMQDELKAVRVAGNKNAASIARQDKVLALINEQKAVDLLIKLEKRIAVMSSKIQTELLKTTVLSEVPRFYPDSWLYLVKALDKSDEWWDEGDGMTIKQWHNRVLLEIAPPVEV